MLLESSLRLFRGLYFKDFNIMSSEDSSIASLEHSPNEPSLREDMYCESNNSYKSESDHYDSDVTQLYDTSVKPLATAKENSEYQRNLTVRANQQKLSGRLSGQVSVDSWEVFLISL